MLAQIIFTSTTEWLSAEMFARDDLSSTLGTFRSRSNAPRLSYVDDRPAPPVGRIGRRWQLPPFVSAALIFYQGRKPMITGTKSSPGLVPRPSQTHEAGYATIQSQPTQRNDAYHTGRCFSRL